MKTLTEQLVTYAHYHRDRRNIATHFFGIPMIVVAVATLLSRPGWVVAGFAVSPATIAIGASLIFYFLLDLRFALVMTMLLWLAGWAGAALAAQPTGTWLGAGLGLFVVGWTLQFIGHAFEGKKPAFVDDLAGFLVGPLFVVAEAGFALGMRTEVLRAIVAGAGPTRNGRLPDAAAQR